MHTLLQPSAPPLLEHARTGNTTRLRVGPPQHKRAAKHRVLEAHGERVARQREQLLTVTPVFSGSVSELVTKTLNPAANANTSTSASANSKASSSTRADAAADAQ